MQPSDTMCPLPIPPSVSRPPGVFRIRRFSAPTASVSTRLSERVGLRCIPSPSRRALHGFQYERSRAPVSASGLGQQPEHVCPHAAISASHDLLRATGFIRLRLSPPLSPLHTSPPTRERLDSHLLAPTNIRRSLTRAIGSVSLIARVHTGARALTAVGHNACESAERWRQHWMLWPPFPAALGHGRSKPSPRAGQLVGPGPACGLVGSRGATGHEATMPVDEGPLAGLSHVTAMNSRLEQWAACGWNGDGRQSTDDKEPWNATQTDQATRLSQQASIILEDLAPPATRGSLAQACQVPSRGRGIG